MTKIIATVWIVPIGARWGVRYNGERLIEDLPRHEAVEAAERVAETLRQSGVKIVNVKTERPARKRGRWG